MNHFEKHGVGYLSASAINSFTSQPALALLKIAGIRDGEAGPAAWRGIAAERPITLVATQGFQDNMDALQKLAMDSFTQSWKNAEDEHDEGKIEKEMKALPDYVHEGVKAFAQFSDLAKEEQGRIRIEIEDIPVPIIGYFDLLYEEDVRDIKTGATMPKEPTNAHKRQMAIYSEATGRRPWIDFVTRKGVGSFSLSPEEVESGMKQFIMAAKALEKILSLSDDIFECCHAVFPDTDHWMWGETTRAAAADIWKYGELS